MTRTTSRPIRVRCRAGLANDGWGYDCYIHPTGMTFGHGRRRDQKSFVPFELDLGKDSYALLLQDLNRLSGDAPAETAHFAFQASDLPATVVYVGRSPRIDDSLPEQRIIRLLEPVRELLVTSLREDRSGNSTT